MISRTDDGGPMEMGAAEPMAAGSRTQTWSDDFEADPRDLEQELRAAWQRALRLDDGALYRGMTLNLIVVGRAERQHALEQTIEHLLVRHPTRAFLILLDPAVDRPSMRVHVRVRQLHRSRHVILERVTLRAPPSARGWLRSTVVPSLLDDLPTMLYWGGDLTYGEVFKELGNVPDHVVVDSTTFGDCDAPRQLLGHDARHLIDLAAFRLKPWRRALAEAFERFTWQPRLGVEVDIQHRKQPSARCAARQLATWLEERLEAKVTLSVVDQDAEDEGGSADILPRIDREPLRVRLINGDVAEVVVQRLEAERQLEVTVDQPMRSSPPQTFQVVGSRGEVGDLLAAAADQCP